MGSCAWRCSRPVLEVTLQDARRIPKQRGVAAGKREETCPPHRSPSSCYRKLPTKAAPAGSESTGGNTRGCGGRGREKGSVPVRAGQGSGSLGLDGVDRGGGAEEKAGAEHTKTGESFPSRQPRRPGHPVPGPGSSSQASVSTRVWSSGSSRVSYSGRGLWR
jgi:hypothetical protein